MDIRAKITIFMLLVLLCTSSGILATDSNYYSNKQLGFEFKYPGNWNYIQTGSSCKSDHLQSDFVLGIRTEDGIRHLMTVKVYSDIWADLHEAARATFRAFDEMVGAKRHDVKIEEIELSGRPGVLVDHMGDGGRLIFFERYGYIIQFDLRIIEDPTVFESFEWTAGLLGGPKL